MVMAAPAPSAPNAASSVRLPALIRVAFDSGRCVFVSCFRRDIPLGNGDASRVVEVAVRRIPHAPATAAAVAGERRDAGRHAEHDRRADDNHQDS